MTALLDHATFILLAAAAIAVLYGAWRLFGTKGLLAAIAALFVLLTYRKGREDGRTTIREKERADADHAVRTADQARIDAGVRDADPDKLRDDDGFRRD